MEEEAELLATPPEWRLLPLWYAKRGRGLLVVAAVIGVVTFFMPWVHVTSPEHVVMSGFQMARVSGWIWAYVTAWVMMIPTVLSRRTIAQMRGARLATGMFSAIPLTTIAILSYKTPHGGLIPIKFTFEPWFYLAGAIALASLPISLLFGGRSRSDDAEQPPSEDSPPQDPEQQGGRETRRDEHDT